MKKTTALTVVLFIGILGVSRAFPLVKQNDNKLQNLRVNTKRMEERILKLAEFGKNIQGGVSRVAFSEADIQGRKYIISLMNEAGLQVKIDKGAID